MYFTFTFQVFASARATRHQNTAVQKNRRAANEWMQTVERLAEDQGEGDYKRREKEENEGRKGMRGIQKEILAIITLD